jgi:hypothetical protein
MLASSFHWRALDRAQLGPFSQRMKRLACASQLRHDPNEAS